MKSHTKQPSRAQNRASSGMILDPAQNLPQNDSHLNNQAAVRKTMTTHKHSGDIIEGDQVIQFRGDNGADGLGRLK